MRYLGRATKEERMKYDAFFRTDYDDWRWYMVPIAANVTFWPRYLTAWSVCAIEVTFLQILLIGVSFENW